MILGAARMHHDNNDLLDLSEKSSVACHSQSNAHRLFHLPAQTSGFASDQILTMIRATICLYLMLASVVGPGLCCCTSLRLMATRCRGGSESFDECPTEHALTRSATRAVNAFPLRGKKSRPLTPRKPTELSLAATTKRFRLLVFRPKRKLLVSMSVVRAFFGSVRSLASLLIIASLLFHWWRRVRWTSFALGSTRHEISCGRIACRDLTACLDAVRSIAEMRCCGSRVVPH